MLDLVILKSALELLETDDSLKYLYCLLWSLLDCVAGLVD